MSIRLTLVTLLLALSVSGLEAVDWSRFRGPNGAGVADDTGLPVEFSPEKNVIWKTELVKGHSSPVFGDNAIFLTGWEGKSVFTFALDRETGRILWRREIVRGREGKLHESNGPASPSATTDGSNAYVFFQDIGLISYGPDGNERWRIALGPFNNPMGMGASPILAEGLIIQICDSESGSFMIAVDKNTGKIVWRNERDFVTRGFSTPVLYDPKDGTGLEAIVAGSYELIAYKVASGEKSWWVRGLTWQLKPTPVMDEDTIYLLNWAGGADIGQQEDVVSFHDALKLHDKDGDGLLSKEEGPDPRMQKSWDSYDLDLNGYMDGRDWHHYRNKRASVNAMNAIRLGGKGDMTEGAFRWRYYKTLPNVPSPLLYDGIVYLVKDGGIVTALDKKTGEVLKQARLKEALDRYFSAPVAADGKIYMLSEAGKVSVLKPGPDWEVIQTNDMGADAYATPAIVDGKMYLRTDWGLYCLAKTD
jgi:outer membrane protein assembly factor BamB